MSAAPTKLISRADADAHAALKILGEGVDQLRVVRPFDLDHDQLLGVSDGTRRVLDRLEAVWLDQVAEIDRREVARHGAGIGVSSTAELLEHAAVQRVRRLGHHPLPPHPRRRRTRTTGLDGLGRAGGVRHVRGRRQARWYPCCGSRTRRDAVAMMRYRCRFHVSMRLTRRCLH